MSAPWRDWPAREPSPGFAERVASAARRARVSRRRGRFGAAAGVALGLAAAAMALVVSRARDDADRRASERPVNDPAANDRPAPDRPAPDRPVNDRPAIERDEAAQISGRPFRWPTSSDWDGPRFTFPLEFSPSLPYRGGVVLHMAPEFDHLGTPDFWTYVAVWVTAARETADPRHLEEDLRTYYTGLCGDSRHPGTYTRKVQVEASARLVAAPLDARDRAVGGVTLLRGTVSARDCKASGGDLALNVEAVTGACEEEGSFVAYALSPQPYEHPIWDALRFERRAFDCKAH